MNVKSFTTLYDLLHDRLCISEAPADKLLVRVSALSEKRLPVILWERQSAGGTGIGLYYPVSCSDYALGKARECTARINLRNLYAGRKEALTGGLGLLEDQHFLYLLYDAATPPTIQDELHNKLCMYMDALAVWLGISLDGGDSHAVCEQRHDL